MKEFARLYTALDETTSTNEKVAALVRYFGAAPPADAAWAVHFLIGRRPKRLVSTPKLRAWAAGEAGIPDWLFEESYHAVGDLAETITLLLPDTGTPTEDVARALGRGATASASRAGGRRSAPRDGPRLARARWAGALRLEQADHRQLSRGGLARLVERALAAASGVPEGVIAHRLMGAWDPTPEFFLRLVAPDTRDADVSRPYPFFLAYPLEQAPEALGEIAEWTVEWKWDGIRAQLIRRAGRTFLWSRGEELLTGRFPEVEEAGALLPEGTVLDGELLPWVGGAPLPFSPRCSAGSGARPWEGRFWSRYRWCWSPTTCWRAEGEDIRSLPFRERRRRLAELLDRCRPAAVSPSQRRSPHPTWEEVAEARLECAASGGRGVDGEAARQPVWSGTAPGRLVEVEGRTATRWMRC